MNSFVGKHTIILANTDDMKSTICKPQLIVITPVRNEAWVLRAFLTATSIWADYIFIADQMSTDGSRDIYKEFPKVKVIDNNLQTMNQAATRRLLFEEVRRFLKGNTNAILFAIDTDEFLCGDFLHSAGWSRILNSEPDDAFCWRWMNLKRGDPNLYSDFCPHYWAVHVSVTLWDGLFPDNFIHEWRLPWPSKCTKEKTYILDDIRFIHLARVNIVRQRNKERFYQVSSIKDTKRYNSFNLYKQYHSEESLLYHPVPEDAYKTYLNAGVNIWQLIDLTDEGDYYSQVVLDCFQKNGTNMYAMLEIWDEDWCNKFDVKNPQKRNHKVLLKWFSWCIKHNNLLSKVFGKLMNVLYGTY